MKYGTKLRVMRLVRGLRQSEVEARAGIPYTYLSRFESGLMLPSPEMDALIRKALNWPENAESAFAILEGQNGNGQMEATA